MSRRSSKNNTSLAGVRPDLGTAVGGSSPDVSAMAAGTGTAANGEPAPVLSRPIPNGMMHDELFKLYVARVATIDRFRVPITDRGLPAAYGRAFDEAFVALRTFHEKLDELKRR